MLDQGIFEFGFGVSTFEVEEFEDEQGRLPGISTEEVWAADSFPHSESRGTHYTQRHVHGVVL